MFSSLATPPEVMDITPLQLQCTTVEFSQEDLTADLVLSSTALAMHNDIAMWLDIDDLEPDFKISSNVNVNKQGTTTNISVMDTQNLLTAENGSQGRTLTNEKVPHIAVKVEEEAKKETHPEDHLHAEKNTSVVLEKDVQPLSQTAAVLDKTKVSKPVSRSNTTSKASKKYSSSESSSDSSSESYSSESSSESSSDDSESSESSASSASEDSNNDNSSRSDNSASNGKPTCPKCSGSVYSHGKTRWYCRPCKYAFTPGSTRTHKKGKSLSLTLA